MASHAEQVTDPTESQSTLWSLIKDIRFAMFTTRHDDGHLHSRPMTTQNSHLDEDANLWFFMSRKSDTVRDITSDPLVNVSYADAGEDSYVSVSGTASTVDDPAKKQRLWSKSAEAWFPQGVNDPDLALVRVRITHANYWDVNASKLVQLYHMARAAITHRPPKNLGEHREIRMG
jgi:general stress protein 26